MIAFRSILALFALAVSAAVAAAQPPTPAVKKTPPVGEELAGPEAAAARAEEVEILRRILNNALHLSDATAAATPAAPPSRQQAMWNVPPGMAPAGDHLYTALLRTPVPAYSFDGVYLPGHGVVFTLRVPEGEAVTGRAPPRAAGLTETCAKCHPGRYEVSAARANAPAAPPTEWEQARRRLRGDAPAPTPSAAPQAPAVCIPGELTEQVVSKLAENVRNVRHLPPGERVTVVVTYAGTAAPGAAGLPSGVYRTTGTVFVLVEPASPGAAKPPTGRLAFTPDEAQQLTLGDLHLKQAKFREAVVAYERALARFKDPVFRPSPPPGLTPAQLSELAAELQKGVRDGYRQVARAWLADGDLEKGQTYLDLARKFTVEFWLDAPARTAAAHPTKLIVSVTKVDADKAGDNLPAFRKAVAVETQGLQAADKARK